MSIMRNLTLASAKHLMTQGHITPAHHAKIVAAVKPPSARPRKPHASAFGSLVPQQAQAPIPGVAPPQAIPTGTATGYEE